MTNQNIYKEQTREINMINKHIEKIKQYWDKLDEVLKGVLVFFAFLILIILIEGLIK